MESIKINKSNSGSPKITSPIAIRFNVGEESLEDVSATKTDSLPLQSSPVHHNDDSIWRKDFLQGGFFNRKRSGSVEGTQSLGVSISGSGNSTPYTSSSSTFTSDSTRLHHDNLGTWKLFKGKVSQAMEDIKTSSTKHDPNQSINNNNIGGTGGAVSTVGGASDHDSDADSITINSSISDEFNDAIQQKRPTLSRHRGDAVKPQNSDSDSDLDTELLQESAEKLAKTPTEQYRRPQSARDSLISKLNRTKDNWTMSGKHRQLLRRKKHDTSGGPVKPEATIEIESGVEITEGMSLTGSSANEGETVDGSGRERNRSKLTKTQTNQLKNVEENCSLSGDNGLTGSMGIDRMERKMNVGSNGTDDIGNDPSVGSRNFFMEIICQIYRRRTVLVGLVAFSISVLCSVPAFLQGVLACLATIAVLSAIHESIANYIIAQINANGGQQSLKTFNVQDYQKLLSPMGICEIQPIEEHTQFKSYSGWMNEIINYNPTNYHISMTRSVFVKLDGSQLRLSNTNARIPKRAMWNEQPIDRKNIIFTRHRVYDLLGCRVEMCPRGLARKRYFSRKYPIQLIIKANPDPDNQSDGNIDNSPTNPSTGSMATTQKHTSNESVENLDFASTILLSDLHKLQDQQDALMNDGLPTDSAGSGGTNAQSCSSSGTKPDAIPCGDDVRILLFARTDREKEDWFRYFTAASFGSIADNEFQMSDMVMITELDILAAMKRTNVGMSSSASGIVTGGTSGSTSETGKASLDRDLSNEDKSSVDDKPGSAGSASTVNDGSQDGEKSTEFSLFEGLLMASCAARCSPNYIKFMSRYQKVCSQKSIPVVQAHSTDVNSRKYRREKKHEDDLWKGIDQSLYLGPSTGTVWANVLIGRVLYSCLNDTILLRKIQDFLQKKLSAIKLPNFMEEVKIAQVNLGETPPLVHRISQPLLDERGTWIDADVTYEGLMHMTITTKLNLLRLRKQQQNSNSGAGIGVSGIHTDPNCFNEQETGVTGVTTGKSDNNSAANCNPSMVNSGINYEHRSNGDAIYDSNAESSGASSSESESSHPINVDAVPDSTGITGIGSSNTGSNSTGISGSSGSGSGKKFLRIVDRITASNLFQSATEIPYIQKAMENMSTKIRLRVELKGLIARCMINIPAPPSDRIWIGFRGPPRLWISATPAVGDHTFDWSIVTTAIENKLCEEVTKYLVYPNMVDVIAPFLGQSTYKE